MSPEGKYELQKEMVSKGKDKFASKSESMLTVENNQNVCFVQLKDIKVKLKPWKSEDGWS